MYNLKDLNNELVKNKLTEKEIQLIIGVCQFVIETLEKCLFTKDLEEEEE